MSNDLLAELAGYRAELSNAEHAGRKDRAAAIKDEIERVLGNIRGRAEALEASASVHRETGQDVLAAQDTVEARRYRAAEPAGDSSRPIESAVDSAMYDTSAPRRGRPKKQES